MDEYVTKNNDDDIESRYESCDEMEEKKEEQNDKFGAVITYGNVVLRNFFINDMVFYRIDWLIKALLSNSSYDPIMYAAHIKSMKKYLVNIESAVYYEDGDFYIHENALPNCLEYLYLLVVEPKQAAGTRPFIQNIRFDKETIENLQKQILKRTSDRYIYEANYAQNIINEQKKLVESRYGDLPTITQIIQHQQSHYKFPGGFPYYIARAEANINCLILEEEEKNNKKRLAQKRKNERKRESKDRKQYPYDIIVYSETMEKKQTRVRENIVTPLIPPIEQFQEKLTFYGVRFT